jgi:hypothetical protein
LKFHQRLVVLESNALPIFAVSQDRDSPHTIPASPRFGHGTEAFDEALETRFYSDSARGERAQRPPLTKAEFIALIGMLERELRDFCAPSENTR